MLLCSLRLINAKIHSIVQESFIFQFPVAIIKINSQSVVERERKKIDRQTYRLTEKKRQINRQRDLDKDAREERITYGQTEKET